MDLTCQTDTRREAVRSLEGRNGLDYIEVGDDQCTLYVYFLGKLPPELSRNGPGLEQYLQIAGGDSITGINVVRVDAERNSDPERDDCLIVTVDKPGDFSVYTLSLSADARITLVSGKILRLDELPVGPLPGAYTRDLPFSFKVGCPSDLDCTPCCECRQPLLDEPRISYLAKDYASFRQLILDRLALLSPDWAERHVPDLGLTLVEVLAYVGDHLSYYQDAVATEAYLGTARQRISVRRHVRLVDYRLHEGCNARAWVHLDVSEDLALPPAGVAFVSGGNAARPLQQNVLGTDQLASVPSSAYEYFEPLLADMTLPVQLRQAHNQICFSTWGQRQCCLMQGATAATLLAQGRARTHCRPADGRHHWHRCQRGAAAARPGAASGGRADFRGGSGPEDRRERRRRPAAALGGTTNQRAAGGGLGLSPRSRRRRDFARAAHAGGVYQMGDRGCATLFVLPVHPQRRTQLRLPPRCFGGSRQQHPGRSWPHPGTGISGPGARSHGGVLLRMRGPAVGCAESPGALPANTAPAAFDLS